jgi:membrane protein YqaA with SNARE-associated domain
MTDLYAHGGLFLSAFIAATILPTQSEAVLSALLISGNHATLGLIATASVGNILGSMVNYVIGRFAARHADARWFPASRESLAKAESWYHRWGRWSLLLSWVPIIGDPLTVAAGVLREPIWSFIVLVTIAKVGRYLVLAAIVLGIAGP